MQEITQVKHLSNRRLNRAHNPLVKLQVHLQVLRLLNLKHRPNREVAFSMENLTKVNLTTLSSMLLRLGGEKRRHLPKKHLNLLGSRARTEETNPQLPVVPKKAFWRVSAIQILTQTVCQSLQLSLMAVSNPTQLCLILSLAQKTVAGSATSCTLVLRLLSARSQIR